jgi:hypothetical protein
MHLAPDEGAAAEQNEADSASDTQQDSLHDSVH